MKNLKLVEIIDIAVENYFDTANEGVIGDFVKKIGGYIVKAGKWIGGKLPAGKKVGKAELDIIRGVNDALEAAEPERETVLGWYDRPDSKGRAMSAKIFGKYWPANVYFKRSDLSAYFITYPKLISVAISILGNEMLFLQIPLIEDCNSIDEVIKKHEIELDGFYIEALRYSESKREIVEAIVVMRFVIDGKGFTRSCKCTLD